MSTLPEPLPAPQIKLPPGTRGRLGASVLRLGRVGRRLLIGMGAVAGVLAVVGSLAWAVLLLQILPRIDAWRFDLAEQATRSLGVPVRIGKVVGRSEGIWPMLSLREVQLLDAAGRVALRLPEVTAGISLSTLAPHALLAGELRLDRLVLVAPELDVRRDREGNFHVAGLKLTTTSAPHGDAGNAAADWVLTQARISISKGTVRWTDEWMGAPTLALQQLDLSLHNRGGFLKRSHDLVIEATPPAEFGSRFALRGTILQPIWHAYSMSARDGDDDPEKLSWWQRWELSTTEPSQWDTWSGALTASLPHVDVQRLKRHVKLPIDINGGRGAVSAELRLDKGVVGGVTLDVGVQDVSVRLGRQLAPLAFKRLQGRLVLTHQPELLTLSFQRLAFMLNDGVSWPASNGKLSWRHAPWRGGFSDKVWNLTKGGQLEADRLDLALLARIVDRLPVSPVVRATLADVAPHGVVEQLAWQWDGPLEAPRSYKIGAQIKGLGWAASEQGSRPGLDKADVTVSADESRGHAVLTVNNGWVAFPGVFEDPRIPLDTLQAKVDWQVWHAAQDGPARMRIDVAEARFANQDATGRLEASWRTGDAADLVEAGRADSPGAAASPAARPGSAVQSAASPASAGASGVSAAAPSTLAATAAPPRFPGVLQLTGRLDRAQATSVWRYLPLAIPKAPRDYVRHAIRSGEGEGVTFEVAGDLDAFPFKNDAGGRFRVTVPMRNVSLDYVPRAIQSEDAARHGTWPAFTSLEGMLLFEGQRMVIKDAKGLLGGVGSGTFALHDVQGRIDDLGQADPHLTIDGQGAGPLNDMVRFLAQSPVGRWTGNVMGRAQSSGTGTMKLALDIPLDRADDTRLNGAVILSERDQASLRLGPGVPMFSALQGTISFTETDLTVTARTRVWGHAAEVSGRRSSDGVTRFVAQGSMSAEGLRQAQEYPLLQRLGQRLSGESPVTVTVSMGKTDTPGAQVQPEIQIASTLQGMTANLPSPLNKTGAAAWPLKVVHRVEDAQGQLDAIVVDLGGPQSQPAAPPGTPWLHVDLRRDTRGEEARVSRGVISLIQSGGTVAAGVPAMPTKGVTAQALAPMLDLDAWLAALKLFKNPVPDEGAALAAGGASTQATSSETLESYLPDSLTVKTNALVLQQRTLRDISGTLAHPSPGVWRAQIESPQVAGQMEWLPEAVPLSTGPGRVVARLSRLSVPQAEAQALQEKAAEQMLSAESTTLPALDIAIDQFEWRGLPLGRLEIEAVNRQVPVPGATALPEWRMTKFRISTPEAQLTAAGNWTLLGAQSATRRPLPSTPGLSVTAPLAATGAPAATQPTLAAAVQAPVPVKPRPRSAFGFTLDLQNSGALLTRLGLPQTIRGGKGKLTGQVSWLGSPMDPDPLTMAGDINVQISEGQFLKVDPGIAKLLGVVSLQSLPRRLTLDFRDVFQSGFVFDGIDGDVKIGQGVANTRNLRMRGLQAVVLLEGQADIARETQNLHVFVVPEVNAAGASLAYAAINPLIGLGTFLAQTLLRKQIANAGTQEFRITGPWADPVVEKANNSANGGSASDAGASPTPSDAAGNVTKPRKPS